MNRSTQHGPSATALSSPMEGAMSGWTTIVDDESAEPLSLSALAEDLQALAKRRGDIACRLAARADVPAEGFGALVRDPDMAVRSAVASNPATPSDLLGALAFSPDPPVAVAVARNPSTSPRVLEAMAEFDGMHDQDIEDEIRFCVASNPQSDSRALGAVLNHGDSEIRQSHLEAVAAHPNASEADLRVIVDADAPGGEHAATAKRRLDEAGMTL